MEELDKRYRRKLEHNGNTTPAKKRKLGITSTLLPPPGAPKWAIDQEWIPPSGNAPIYRIGFD